VSLTALAIDGVGQATSDHLALLRTTARLLNVSHLRLLTSDPAARDPEVECHRIDELDYSGYSRFCVEELTQFVDTEHCLCLQLDGFVLNPDLWDDGFLCFDYVGAPWLSTKRRPLEPGCNVGNGGFSLRSKRFLDASADLCWYCEWEGVDVPRKYWGNEDYFLTVLNREQLRQRGIRFAPQEVAARFSIQSGDQLEPGHNLRTVLGFHGQGLLGKARLHTERRGIHYPHLQSVRRSFFPLRY
jgi:hypothetical protein